MILSRKLVQEGRTWSGGTVYDESTTVLIAAADSGDKESLERLLARGANIHAVLATPGAVLSAAASEGDENASESCWIMAEIRIRIAVNWALSSKLQLMLQASIAATCF